MSDIEIAQSANKIPILELAIKRLHVKEEHLIPYGKFKAKLSLTSIQRKPKSQQGRLILVSAMSPTPAGEGKTTTTVGLGDALNRLGHNTIICLREPSLGPCFGIKGGAAGGGYSQVVPMEDINLHFTGDFHAITSANNLLSALIDNHINHDNALDIDPRSITFKRVLDMNDRAVRDIVLGLGGAANGYPREGGFDITVASEIMAIFCLATSIKDLKTRLGKIVVAYSSKENKAITASDLNAQGAMAALLKDAINPNIVQTLENNIAFVRGGPFANIAHGCNTVTATETALGLADYVVTEAGFGADLGAEKFIDIKCRAADLKPQVVVLVATIRALKFHGAVDKEHLGKEDLEAINRGFVNLKQHYENITNEYGLPCIICINHFSEDTDAEVALLEELIQAIGGTSVLSKHWELGGEGAEKLAETVKDILDKGPYQHSYIYHTNLPLWEKINAIATKIYGASEVKAPVKIRKKLDELGEQFPDFPVCIAKTQMSFSSNPEARGAPKNHVLEISDAKVSAGAGFIVVIAGNMMTMPGLPKVPAAEKIDIDDEGNIVGLF
jgi:formate--tetrahydrofolate ligase